MIQELKFKQHTIIFDLNLEMILPTKQLLVLGDGAVLTYVLHLCAQTNKLSKRLDPAEVKCFLLKR